MRFGRDFADVFCTVYDIATTLYRITDCYEKDVDIKIFVSNRIDLDSKQIDNPLLVPVRCGAVFDERENIGMLGDNTGDNISGKRMSFNELTVQYWAWKNQKADYCGICHYRRFLTFNPLKEPKSFEERNNGCISFDRLSEENIQKCGLTKERMLAEIPKYDAVFIEPIDLKNHGGISNYQAMKNCPEYHNIKDVDAAISIVKKRHPEMADIADEYMFKYRYSYLYNCFVMKSDLFDKYSEWLFGILFELEPELEMSHYTMQQYRTPGTIAERLLGIYILYLERKTDLKIKHVPLAFFENTDGDADLTPAFEGDSIPIVSNFNNNYAPVFLVFLQSFIEAMDRTKNYDFIILISDITSTSKKYISDAISPFRNISIRYCNPNYILKDVDKKVFHECYTSDLYYRITIPYLLERYDKVIVLDADTICKRDISSLYEIDVSDYLLGAVKDTVMQGYLNGARGEFLPYLENKLKLSNPYDYVNTGVCVMNCRAFRKLYTREYIVNFISNNISKVYIYEQDMINKLCDGKIKFINPAWNYFAVTSDFIKKCITLSGMECRIGYEKAKLSPYIIHYAAVPKPWNNPDVEFGDQWWHYARKTPCYESFLKTMAEYAVHCALFPPPPPKKKSVLKYYKYKIFRHIMFGEIKQRYERKYREMKKFFKRS